MHEFPKNAQPAIMSKCRRIGNIGLEGNRPVAYALFTHERLARHERHTTVTMPKIGIGNQKSSNRDVQALHEAAADQVTVIADPRRNLPVAVQEKANVFDAAQSQDIRRRRYIENFATVILNAKVGYARVVVIESYVDNVCIVKSVDLLRLSDFRTVLFKKPRWRTDPEDIPVKQRRIKTR